MEERTLRVIFYKSGGGSGKNTTGTRISLPKTWMTELGITEENREVILTFDGDKITIQKKQL